ncbi:hypothetical protein [Nonomuraea typhae]|uniref:Uncharacterized protein n=1 Tax=Nonomuraea typhae TaxID=2603600 RepID=A0ABW7Z6S5_9ACTN
MGSKMLGWGWLTGLAAGFGGHSSHVIKQVEANVDEIGSKSPFE